MSPIFTGLFLFEMRHSRLFIFVWSYESGATAVRQLRTLYRVWTGVTCDLRIPESGGLGAPQSLGCPRRPLRSSAAVLSVSYREVSRDLPLSALAERVDVNSSSDWSIVMYLLIQVSEGWDCCATLNPFRVICACWHLWILYRSRFFPIQSITLT